jgi:hypothetical protein
METAWDVPFAAMAAQFVRVMFDVYVFVLVSVRVSWILYVSRRNMIDSTLWLLSRL